MGTYELFEESVRNRFSYDVTCVKENQNTISTKGTGFTFYLNEEETKQFQEKTFLPTIVYDWNNINEERNYYLKLKSQGLRVKEYKLGDDLIVMESRFENEETYSNAGPIIPIEQEEMYAIEKFHRSIVKRIKNRKEIRLPILFGMIKIENWGAIRQMTRFPEYAHLKF